MLKKRRKIIFVLLILGGLLFIKISSSQIRKGLNEIKFKNFTLSNTLILGTGEDKNNTFNSPSAVGVDKKGNIYIVDKGNHRIQVFSNSGKYIRTIGRGGDVKFSFPRDLILDDEDNIYVVNYDNRRIQILSNEGKILNSFKVSFYPDQIVVDKTFIYLYVVLEGKHLIYKYSKNGKFISGFSKISKGIDFHNRVNLCFDSSGNLYLAYRFLPKVKKYSPEGELLMEFEYKPSIKNQQPPLKIITKKIEKRGRFFATGMVRGKTYPICYDIAVDGLGIIYLLVASDHKKDEICTLYRFDPSGNLLEKAALPIPCGKIYIDTSNNFYFLSQVVNMLVYKYTPTQ
jgi:hypothetical protein